MKNIKDLTERDCIHCRTQEEWDGILAIRNPWNVNACEWIIDGENSVIFLDGEYADLDYARRHGYTIHPASDFLTPQVSVLTEIGDTKVIKNGGDVIVMTGNVVITLTPPVLKHIQELLNQQQ